MKGPSTQLYSAAAAVAARLVAGVAAAQVNSHVATADLTTSTVDLASAGVGAAVWLAGAKDWKAFGMWLGIIGAVDYINPIISPALAQSNNTALSTNVL